MDNLRCGLVVVAFLVVGCSSSDPPAAVTDGGGDASCTNVSAEYGPACAVRTDGGFPFAWTCPDGVAHDAGASPLVTNVGGALLCGGYYGGDGAPIYCCPAPIPDAASATD